jgi:hypothetical protein
VRSFLFASSSWVRCMVAGLGLLVPFLPAKAASVAIDTLTVNNIALTFSITGIGAVSRSGAIAPVTIEMGTYQDPIAAGSFSAMGAWKIYSAGVAGTPPPPSGTVDAAAGTINVDFSSLRGKVTFPIFGSSATFDLPLWPLTTSPTTNSYNALTDAYTLSWDKSFSRTITLGSFSLPLNGTASVTLSGTVQAVPLPGAIWLLGSGIMGFGVFLRRKTKDKAQP